MIKSPKEKFQSSQVRTSQWAQIIANPLFDEACDSALLYMLEQQPVKPELAPYLNMESVGAQRFIRILKTIHEKTEQPKEPTRQGLNYQAGV